MPTATEELRACVKAPLETARAMPPSVYTSPEFARAELERIFARDWYSVGRADLLRKPGDYLTGILADTPFVVLRDADGQLRALSNTCLHRMSTLLEGRGNIRAITCPYHGWTYNLDGSLRGAPAMGLNRGFCKQDMTLPAIRAEEWLGWVFITLDPKAAPVASRLARIEEMVGALDMGAYVQSFYEEHVWDTNWKVLAENFMESYHLPVCHAGTIGGLSKLEEMHCPPGEPGFNWHRIFKDDTLKIALAHPRNTRLRGDIRRTTWLFAIYPSLLITLTPGYFWYLSLHPKGPGQVHIRFGGGMSADFAGEAAAQTHFAQLKELLERVNEEDRGCTERVYRGLGSRLARPGPLSHLERPNHEFAAYILSRVEAG